MTKLVIGSCICTFDWHQGFEPWITLFCRLYLLFTQVSMNLWRNSLNKLSLVYRHMLTILVRQVTFQSTFFVVPVFFIQMEIVSC